MTTASFDWTFAEPETTTRGVRLAKARIGPELRAILVRKDDRLLRDIGVTRDELLGPEEAFRADQRTKGNIWTL